MPSAKDRRSGRHYLGKASAVALRQRVYRTRECLEVDEIDGYDVVRKRVFFDEVLLVTYHRFLGLPFLLAMGVFIALFGLISAFMAVSDRRAGLVFALFLVGPFLLAFVLRMVLKVDAVTVYGKRSKAQVHFPFRKARAREVYVQICRAVREHQQRATRVLQRAQPAAPAPPPPA
jgi:hypothetical protein